MTEEPRELGVAVDTCPECGAQVQQVELPDGSVAGEPCKKCYPNATPVAAETEKASEGETMPRERGTVIVEQENPA